MRISIGVPAYNQGPYLAETLDSLLNQTVPPDEIVVSDNHSTDETPDILRGYEGRVRIIRPPEHLPMNAHWSYLVGNLTGDWFSLLSSDDVAEPDFVRHLSRAVTCDRHAVLVRGGWLRISPTGQRTGRCLLWSTSSVTQPPRTLLEQLDGPKVSFAAFLCRRSAWTEVGGFQSSLRASEWGLWLRLSAVGSFVTTHRVVSRYRTGYPTSHHLGRLVDIAHDERLISLEVTARAAQELGLPTTGVMQRAAARRLTTFLAQMSELVADEEVRSQIAAELRPVALATGLERTLGVFSAGQPVAARPVRLRTLASGASVIDAQLRTVAGRLRRLGGSR